VLLQILGIVVSKLEISLIDKLTLKLDMILILIFGVLLILLNKNKNRKIKKFIIALIFILSTSNIIYNAVHSMKIIREDSSKIGQNGYVLTINEYMDMSKFLKEYDNKLYRTERDLTLTPNDALSFGYNGVRIFWFSIFKIISKIFKKHWN